MFAFTQTTRGLYFSEEPSQIQTASELKKAAAVALGRPEEQQKLLSAKEFFRARFQ